MNTAFRILLFLLSLVSTVVAPGGALADPSLTAQDSRNRGLLLATRDDRPTWFLELSYEGGVFSGSFIELIFEYGTRVNGTITERRDLELLVQETCSGVTEANLLLFSKVLEEQGLIEVTAEATTVVPNASAVLLPPCLPFQEFRSSGRVVLINDNIFNYFTADTNCPACSPTKWRDSDELVEGLESELRARVLELSSSFQEETEQEVNRIAAETGKTDGSRLAVRFADPTLDESQVAFQVLVAILFGSIESSVGEASVGVLDQLKSIRPLTADRIARGLQPTLSQIEKSGMSPVEYLTKLIQIAKAHERTVLEPNRSGEMMDYRSHVLRLSPMLTDKSSIEGLGLGDVVFTPIAIKSTERIPIDLAVVATVNGLIADDTTAISSTDRARIFEDAKRIFQERLDQANIFVAQAAPAVSLGDDLSVTFTNVAPEVCTNSDASAISDTSLLAAFLEHAFHTRLKLARQGVSPKAVTVAIADSGFVRSFGEGMDPFRWTIDSSTDFRDWMPVANLPAEKRIHGTEVAGVAVGGPLAWGLSDALGVDLQIVPGRIYGANRTNSSGEAEVSVALLNQLLGSEPNIINMSIGERSPDGSDGPIANAIEDELKSGTGPLFVVAAGNNGANHLSVGQLVETTRLYPQTEGGTSGVNILVVGALDGPSIARFSNFSDQAVSLMAPGCRVKTWFAEDQSSPYREIEVSGTSFSAPLVTYVAALVRSLSPQDRQLAKYVRARILASSDLHPELIEKATHGRVLNPAKAILLYDDVVFGRFNGETSASLKRGVFNQDIALQRLCQQPPAQNGILLKFAKSPLANADGRYIYYLWNESQGLISGQCIPRTSVLFKAEGEESFKPMQLENVDDIVFQWRDQ